MRVILVLHRISLNLRFGLAQSDRSKSYSLADSLSGSSDFLVSQVPGFPAARLWLNCLRNIPSDSRNPAHLLLQMVGNERFLVGTIIAQLVQEAGYKPE